MPLIEELPVTSTIKASHGWAYVPDIGPIAAQQPGNRDRKRAAAVSSKQSANASAKQQKAIQQRLDSLNKENYKDGVTVPIPTRMGASAREKIGKKMTGNVRRILTYQRGFAHYLADEEANNPGGIHYQIPTLTSGMGPPPAPVSKGAAVVDAKSQKIANTDRRKSGTTRARSNTNELLVPVTPVPTPQSRGRKRGRADSRAQANTEETDQSTPTRHLSQVKAEDPDTPMTDATTIADLNPPRTDPTSTSPPHSAPDPDPPYPPSWDNDPLLLTTPDEVPRMPSDKIMQLLMSEPPLTYTAVRATPLEPDQQRPARHFCGVCGYWGRVRCRKCEEWTCGIMECWRGHEGVCVVGSLYV